MSFMDEFNFWLNDDYFDQATKDELLKIKDNESEIEERFYKELEFGTGGLRGVIGAGTNRMNIYTVRKASQGLANYIIKANGQERGIAIAYDSRFMSPEFADEAALCMAANGIKAYVFESLRPTPELSFALRTLGCISGIVITASHNPPEYNGYKVYWEDGAQITAPKDKEIIGEVQAVTDYHTVKTMDKQEAINAGLYQVIGKEIDDAYMAELKKQIIHPDVIQAVADDIKIVYTPLCGTGNKPVRRILSELGFKNVYVVPEQENPDPKFTTLDYPNPEDPKAFTYALKLAKEKNADIVLATDPDADRLGIYELDTKSGEYKAFTGNMSGMLIAEYILRERKATGTMPENPALVTTIVTTNMTAPITKAYDVKLIEVLTGFKFIGEQIKLFEQTGSNNYVFGLEESYGSKQIAALMDKFRNNPPKKFGELDVVRLRDYENDVITELETGKTYPTGLPKSNVLYFDLTNDSWCCARPSGTEPKIKFYMGVKGTSLEDAQKKVENLTNEVKAVIEE